MAGTTSPGGKGPAKRRGLTRAALRGFGRFAGQLIQRAYALAIIAVVGWLSWRALYYLIASLILPGGIPVQIGELPLRLDEQTLRTEPTKWAGITATQNPRAPLAHYHRLDGWFQIDRANDCTRAGCHEPLPHQRSAALRSFLNMHATTLNCTVCHLEPAARPVPLVWYTLDDGRVTGPPALLRAYDWVTGPAGEAALEHPTAADQDEIVALLRQAADEADGEPALLRLVERTRAVRPDGDAFRTALTNLRRDLPAHFRGDYGAKLAPRGDDSGQPLLHLPATTGAAEEFLAAGESLSADQRQALVTRMHEPLRPAGPLCTACHTPDGPLLDLAGAGYPPQRLATLYGLSIARAIEDVATGQPLHMPTFVVPPALPASAPASSQVEP
ncbi:MAG: hypothetical protein PVJ57_03200 [Phycisphaerae bacterium]|jgi:hypothetical protein